MFESVVCETAAILPRSQCIYSMSRPNQAAHIDLLPGWCDCQRQMKGFSHATIRTDILYNLPHNSRIYLYWLVFIIIGSFHFLCIDWLHCCVLGIEHKNLQLIGAIYKIDFFSNGSDKDLLPLLGLVKSQISIAIWRHKAAMRCVNESHSDI